MILSWFKCDVQLQSDAVIAEKNDFFVPIYLAPELCNLKDGRVP